MSPIDQLNQWLADVQPGAALNENGTAAFLIDEGIEVILATDHQSPVILLFAELLPLQGLDPEAVTRVSRHCLHLNSWDEITGDASLALDTTQNRVVFNQSVPWEGLEAAQLWDIYDHFAANTKRLWATFHGQVDDNGVDNPSESDSDSDNATPAPVEDTPPPMIQPWNLA